MSDVTTPKVGNLLEGSEGRDAIHFALAPVQAAEDIYVGAPVKLLHGSNRQVVEVRLTNDSIGLADPWLLLKRISTIWKGEWFWMFLHPGTITELRHVWKHPAFNTQRELEQYVKDMEKAGDT